MSKVLLINPWNYHEEGYIHSFKQWSNGPYALILLATILKRNGHDVRLWDGNVELFNHKGSLYGTLTSLALASLKADIAGVTLMSMQIREAEKIVETLKVGMLQRPIVAGGIHATVAPYSCTQIGFTYTLQGPGEKAILKIANGDFTTGGVATDHLDDLPFPDWSFVSYPFYKESKWHSLDLLMSRGCAHHCSFCAYSFMEPLRFHSAKYLLQEVDYMKKDFQVNSLYITDSTIGTNNNLLTEFCEGMIEKNIQWVANIRADQVSPSLLRLMHRAGCIWLFYGFESGSDRILHLMNKQCTVNENLLAASMTRSAGIKVHASIIKDYPTETKIEWRQTLRMLSKMRPDTIGINSYAPLPGSRDWNGSINFRDCGESRSIRVRRLGKWILPI